jgi:hypothetical protein
VARILDLPHKLVVLTWKLLVEVNRTHSFANLDNYKKMAKEAHGFVKAQFPT